jgi:hypothetical protein
METCLECPSVNRNGEYFPNYKVYVSSEPARYISKCSLCPEVLAGARDIVVLLRVRPRGRLVNSSLSRLGLGKMHTPPLATYISKQPLNLCFKLLPPQT